MPRTRKSATPEPTPESITATAEEQARLDKALLDSLTERDGVITPQPAPRNPTISDNFFTSAAMLAQAKTTYRLNEGTLIKLYELNLMWALNNRQTTDANLVRDDDLVTPESGEEIEGPSPSEVNEHITAAPDAEEA